MARAGRGPTSAGAAHATQPGLDRPPADRRRLDPSAVRRTLREAGLRPRHALSQNFLADPDVLERILDEASPIPGRTVLEIGPGLGILTRGLLDAGAAVTAVELDAGLAARLRAVFSAELEAGTAIPMPPGSLRLIEDDVLDVELGELVDPPFDVVANLPYHITSPVLHRLLGGSSRPDRLVVMVQREVAERIAAPPGRMSYLSAFVQYHAAVRISFVVPREAFEPAPEVDSAVVVLTPFPSERGSRLEPAVEDDLWRLVQAGFRERRKMLHNVLSRQLPLSRDEVERALEAAGIDGERRPQTLSVEEWLRLLAALGPPLPEDRRGRPNPG